LRLRVKLFGTLPQPVPGDEAETGLEIKLPDGAKISDLLAHLEIPEMDGYMVAMDNRVKRSIK
jgi:sulfur carrier protein ThiS